MGENDDDCDLDTLSALLEEEDADDVSSAQNLCQQTSSPAAASGASAVVTQENGQSAGARAIDRAAEEEMDMETLSSMLDQDSDLEDASGQQDQGEVTAEDIAAFFDGSSDSDNEADNEKEDTEQGTSRLELPGSDSDCVETSQHGTGPTQQDPQHVRQLQDELVMMQQRMMEIQQMLASQTPTTAAATSSRPVAPPSSTTVKLHAKPTGSPKMASASSSQGFSSSSPTSSKTFNSSSKKVKPLSSASASSHTEKKRSLGHSSSATGTGRSTNPASTSNHGAIRGAASSALHSSSDSKPQHSTSRNDDGSTKCKNSVKQISDGTEKKKKTRTVNTYQSKGADRRDSLEHRGPKEKPSSKFLADVAENGTARSQERRELKRSLFGDDSDSDWEDLDGEKAQLSSSGKDIKRLLQQGQQQHQTHTPSYRASPSTTTLWTSKAAHSTSQSSGTSTDPSRPSSSGSGSSTLKKEADTKDYITEKFSGLRVINPKVSSIMLASKMESRRMIAVSKMHLKLKTPDLQGDWVTIAVIVQKSEARKSQTGKTYSIWKLSDLQDTDTTVSFFLFGQVYKQLWKMDVGTVVGLLNPNIMDAMEKSPGDVAFTVKNAQQVMEIGQSKDLGWCIGRTKRGATCTNFVNKKLGDFCTYHVQAAYRKQSAKRNELHGSCPGTTPKSSLKSKILQNNTFFYGGECYSASRNKGGGGGKKDKVTLSKLQAVMTHQEQRKVNTLAIQNLLPAQNARVQSTLSAQHKQPFSQKCTAAQVVPTHVYSGNMDMLSVPTAGSMNLVRHIANAEGKTKDSKRVNKGEAVTFQSINAGDLLKEHRKQIKERIHSRRQQLKTSQQSGLRPPSKNPGQSSPGQSQTKSPGQSQTKSPGQSQTKNPAHSQSEILKLPEPLPAGKEVIVLGDGKTLEEKISIWQSKGSTVADTPSLGKGFYPGGKIDLFAKSSAGSLCKLNPTDVAKRKAIQKVQAIGGLDKANPNAVRAAPPDPDKVRKRVHENIENKRKKPEEGNGKLLGQSAEPAQKKSRLLGNVDPNSEEVKQLLNARSSHTGALAQAEAEREERYFDNLEKKEMMEEKMKTIRSMEVTVFSCEQCKYTAMSQSERCKRENHVVRRHKGKQRFFACKKCKQRTVSLHRYPASPCKKCGEHSYEKTSMYKEKSGPKLENEMLCLRGDESKFMGSMDQKVYMSTVVQD